MQLEAMLVVDVWWCSLCAEEVEVCHIRVGREVQRTHGCWMFGVDAQCSDDLGFS
jgi:hypothetical protein